MDTVCIRGGAALSGVSRVCGAKNAVLPILGASLLTRERVELFDVPNISDAENMLRMLSHIGCDYTYTDDSLIVDASEAGCWEMPDELSKVMRSSIFMLGPVVARFKKARFTFPGGCDIGNRPIDLHLKGLRELNVNVSEEHGYITCDGADMRGAQIHLDYPSVGATENIMMAATAAEGVTVIHNAAREPEIIDLQKFLRAMGASVEGAGTSSVTVCGKKPLHGASHRVIPDRILAGTLICAAAITASDITLENIEPEHLRSVLAKLSECGCVFEHGKRSLRVIGPLRPAELHIVETLPYPGFPTDMQSQLFALLTVASGTSVIVENVFENRFRHAAELSCMGAQITIKDRMAIIRGVEELTGAAVKARDLRGGAALVLAGLRASGVTRVQNAQYIHRGYENIAKTLCALGADCWEE